jgi:uncharacterized membrane protein
MNCCIVISCLYGVIFLNERIGLWGGIGFMLMALAMVLLNFDFSRKRESVCGKEKKPRISLKWALLITLTLLGDGFCQVSQSSHQNAYPGEHRIGFMLWAMLTWCVIYFFAMLCKGNFKMGRAHLRGDTYAVLSGLSNSFANYCILMLAALSATTLLFPTISVACMLGALLCGLLLFGEKLKLQQIVGFVAGVGSVFLLQI